MSAVRELNLGDGYAETGIVKAVEANPLLVLVDEAKFDELYAEMMREVKAFVPDLSTATSRKEIASLAFKVTRTKTAIDAAGKKLNEDARKQINAVDASRRVIKTKLEALADEVRAPLTAWEDAEKTRIEAHQKAIVDLEIAAIVAPEDTANVIQSRIDMLETISIDALTWQEFAPAAKKARDQALAVLGTNLERIAKAEAERAELAKLRAEAAARAEADAARLAAEKAERDRVEREKAETERRARAAEEEQARLAEVEARARREALADAKRREEEAAAAHAAEIKRMKDAQDARDREAARAEQAKADAERAEKEEVARRAADREHRGKIMGEAKAALMDGLKLSETKAKDIVLAIAAGSVPHVLIRF